MTMAKRPMDVAYEYIKERIMNGTFLPSQKLNESELSAQIGVSRNTVKKALFKLEQEHLVDMEENKGATVKSFTVKEVSNYFEIREALEGLIIRSAVERLTEEDLRQMEEICEKMETYLDMGDFEEYSQLNKRFHDTIYRASDNQQAVEMVNLIKGQLLRYHLRTILIPGRKENSAKEHQQIYRALKERNAEEAENAVRRHIANIRKTIEEHFAFLV
ncbi:GntR family transcriptional regulator [Geobacillus zalihae]|uniref:GntR family transcriptional regulator n=1 Tax=Geobacillus TaxID=129337 RepID=UPI00064AD3E5|nr:MULTISPECIES: GntR family transcriptional regulator [Geobacillus]KLR75424.1 transcriptional regulator [Geobacillus sp. T6]WKA48030.1 GntR family transcriptional regulator [Geobacillus zalihae]